MSFLEGVVAFVDVVVANEDRSAIISYQIEKAGGQVSKKLTKDVTHYVFKNGSIENLKKSSGLSAKVVTLSWIANCITNKAVLPELEYLVDINDIISNPTSPYQRSNFENRLRLVNKSSTAEMWKRAENKVNRKRKRLDKMANCLREELIPPDAHPIVKDAMERAILARVNPDLLQSPRLDLFTPFVVETPPSMKEKMEQFRQRLLQRDTPSLTVCDTPDTTIYSPLIETPLASIKQKCTLYRPSPLATSPQENVDIITKLSFDSVECTLEKENQPPDVENIINNRKSISKTRKSFSKSRAIGRRKSRRQTLNSSKLMDKSVLIFPPSPTVSPLQIVKRAHTSGGSMGVQFSVIDESDDDESLVQSEQSRCTDVSCRLIKRIKHRFSNAKQSHTKPNSSDSISTIPETSVFQDSTKISSSYNTDINCVLQSNESSHAATTHPSTIPETSNLDLSEPSIKNPILNPSLPISDNYVTYSASPQENDDPSTIYETSDLDFSTSKTSDAKSQSTSLPICLDLLPPNSKEDNSQVNLKDTTNTKFFVPESIPLNAHESFSNCNTIPETELLDIVASPIKSMISKTRALTIGGNKKKKLLGKQQKLRCTMGNELMNSPVENKTPEALDKATYKSNRSKPFVPKDSSQSTLDTLVGQSRLSIDEFRFPHTKRFSTSTRENIVLTSMHTREQTEVKKLLENLCDSKLSKDVNSFTSHVIVGEDQKRTLNVMHGISRGCWIVSIDWIRDSVKNGSRLREEAYEVMKFEGAHISRECRLLSKNLYRCDFIPMIPIVIGCYSKPPQGELVHLIGLAGGWVVNSPRQAQYCIGRSRIPLKIPFVSESWIFDCISRGRQLDIADYVQR